MYFLCLILILNFSPQRIFPQAVPVVSVTRNEGCALQGFTQRWAPSLYFIRRGSWQQDSRHDRLQPFFLVRFWQPTWIGYRRLNTCPKQLFLMHLDFWTIIHIIQVPCTSGCSCYLYTSLESTNSMGRFAGLLSHAQTVFHLLGKSTFAEQRTEGETLCVFHLLGQLTVTKSTANSPWFGGLEESTQSHSD